MERMSVGDRVLLRLKKLNARGHKKNQAGLASACDLTRGAITHLVKNHTTALEAHEMVRAADYLGCEIRWLITGHGPEERIRQPEETRLLEYASKLPRKTLSAILDIAEITASVYTVESPMTGDEPLKSSDKE